MLYRSTMKIATATILGLMALFGVSAHAVVDLDETGSDIGTVVFSKETLATAAAGTTYFPVQAAASSDTLEIKAAVGTQIVGQTSGETAVTVAVRYDLLNMAFIDFPTDAELDVYSPDIGPSQTIPPESVKDDIVTVSVRTSGRTFVEYRLTLEDGETLTAGSTVRLTLIDHLAVSATEPGRIRLRINPGQQSSFEDPNPRDVTKTAVVVANSISVLTEIGSATAEVTTGFTRFAGGGTSRPLGVLNLMVNEAHYNAQDGSLLSAVSDTATLLNDTSENGTLTITFRNTVDDFEFASFRLVEAVSGVIDCGSGGSGTDLNFIPSGQTEPNFEMSVLVDPEIGRSGLCMTLKEPEEGEDAFVLPDTVFTIDANFVKSSDRQFVPTSVSGVTLGVLQHNGSTIHIPFLSVHERHNQRLIIVNRGRDDVEYEMVFTSAEGVEVTPVADTEGVVPGNRELILRVAEMINIQDSNQTAATLTLVASPRTIDVLTSTLTDNGASDTVNYDVR